MKATTNHKLKPTKPIGRTHPKKGKQGIQRLWRWSRWQNMSLKGSNESLSRLLGHQTLTRRSLYTYLTTVSNETNINRGSPRPRKVRSFTMLKLTLFHLDTSLNIIACWAKQNTGIRFYLTVLLNQGTWSCWANST